MNSALILGFTAATLQIVGLAIYNKQIVTGHSKPNAASWGLWTFLSALNTVTYIVFTGDIVKGIMPLTISVAIILTFFYALVRGKFSKLGYWDKSVLEIGIVAIAVWWFYQSALYANMVLQFGIAVSYIPTYLGVARDASNEKAPPWLIWGVAYALGGVVVLLRWTGQFEALIYPFVNALLSVGVGYLVIKNTK